MPDGIDGTPEVKAAVELPPVPAEIPTPPIPISPAEAKARIAVIINNGVGMKTKTVPLADVEKELEKIARIGFVVDKSDRAQVVYTPSRIERIEVTW